MQTKLHFHYIECANMLMCLNAQVKKEAFL